MNHKKTDGNILELRALDGMQFYFYLIENNHNFGVKYKHRYTEDQLMQMRYGAMLSLTFDLDSCCYPFQMGVQQ